MLKPISLSRRYVWLAFLVLIPYVGSYYFLSRLGFRDSDEHHMIGFYFVTPLTPERACLNTACVVFYSPLILIDNVMGTGRYPGISMPLSQLEARKHPSKQRCQE